MGLMRMAANAAEITVPETPTDRYRRIRQRSTALAAGLSAEDQAAQSMADASPVKWHLAHTTWFFEQLLLRPRPGYRPADPAYDVLFNSYYESLGPRIARHQRGLMTRPSAAEILAYRAHVDAAMISALEAGGWPEGSLDAYLFELGLNHEQQHQELILTDVLHLLAQSPLAPAYSEAPPAAAKASTPVAFLPFTGGPAEIGWDGAGFAFDNEGPRHGVTLAPFELADRLTTNAEWLAFMDDGGYRRADLWMSDGWARVQSEGWRAPLYWTDRDGEWRSMTLHGLRPLEPNAPVSHVSWYEADAFARWSGARLPTEAEWETAAAGLPIEGTLAPHGALRPTPAGPPTGKPRQMFGDVWEWTGSAYLAYPGFRPTRGTAAEYNGKFMINQMVLRGGSIATPQDHLRATYRNFFYPHHRWQFVGVRLARDLARASRPPGVSAFLTDLQAGLAQPQKSISPKWFYDDAGSRLFDDITGLAEYYPTRVETALLADIAGELSEAVPEGAVIVEFGSGASAKTRLLLDATPQAFAYAPVDISPEALSEAAARIEADYPNLTVSPQVADFTKVLTLPPIAAGRPVVGFFPGSTIGNFTPEEARAFMASVRGLLGRGAAFIVGVDLVKPLDVLLAAYNDAQGVTAAFNKNLLIRANRELGADFDPDAFAHEAIWNPARSRIEMHLISRVDQTVTVGGRRYAFARGETLHTENSHKFTPEGFRALAASSGWRLDGQWISPAPEFGIFLLRS